MGCPYPYEATICTFPPEDDNYEQYMQHDETRLAIHVGDLPYGQQTNDVFQSMTSDFMQYGQDNVEFLLEEKYPVSTAILAIRKLGNGLLL